MFPIIIDINFNVTSDARGKDPDSYSPTLRKYHKCLWSKALPNGKFFKLSDDKNGAYLYHKSDIGEVYLWSDTITHSYKEHKRKEWLTNQIPKEVEEFYNVAGATIGSFIIFPSKQVNGNNSINQARGVNSFIDDRFDLTLECIRLFYLWQMSPLYDTLLRYKDFFDLFENFNNYVIFFLLDDLIDEKGKIKFYLPFDGFKTRPIISNIDDYLIYKKGVMSFIESRNKRIANISNLQGEFYE